MVECDGLSYAIESKYIDFKPKSNDIASTKGTYGIESKNMNDIRSGLVTWRPSESVFATSVTPHRIESHSVRGFLVGLQTPPSGGET